VTVDYLQQRQSVNRPYEDQTRHMTTETNRSTRISFVFGLVLVAFAVGLALALGGSPPVGQSVPRVVGALGIVSGLVLITPRNLFKRDGVVPTPRQLSAEHSARMRMRLSGVTGIVFGVAQFMPDIRLQAAFMLCAAAVSMAGVFRVPRRLFILNERAE
jgi:hypothetical protein